MNTGAAVMFVSLLLLLAWALGHACVCNIRRYGQARRLPPLLTTGSSRKASQGPWEGSWQPWPTPDPDAMPPELARRYADLCAGKSANQKLTSELMLIILAAALGAAVPKLFTPAGTSPPVAEDLLVVALVLGCVVAILIRRRASYWDRVTSVYDECADVATETARANTEAPAQTAADDAAATARWWNRAITQTRTALRRR